MNALEVLRAIRPNEALGVTEIARELGLSKVAVQRILVTLHAGGWLAPTMKGPTRWLAGPELFALSAKFRKGWDLRPTALPVMHDLRDQTGETIALGVLRNRYTVWIEQLRSLHGLAVTNAVGEIVPCHATAAGKAILARLSDDQVRTVVGDLEETLTSKTITNIDSLLADLAITRRRGYSVSLGEGMKAVVGIAAVIDGPQGDPIAALSIAGPEARLTKLRIAEFGQLVMDAAAKISAEMS